MACTNCSTKSGSSIPNGCGSNGNCGTDSCNKLGVFDWLSNMKYPNNFQVFDIVEIRFKNGRKEYFKNDKNLSLQIGDTVATEATSGHDIGVITLTGELVRAQLKKRKISLKDKFKKLYRKANQKDIDIWQSAQNKEESIKKKARELAIKLQLEMKISDVEYQGDASKVIFYYTATERVDFRQLIKEYAREFRVRIEMKQIGFRQEASRLGGVGSCGRELCCSTWLTDYRSVSTSAARYQQLSLNPQKLAGQCGKLKCCLNFELDTYLDALKSFPNSDVKLKTEKGHLFCHKTDIFKQIMWFTYPDKASKWYPVKVKDVLEIIALNKEGKLPEDIEDYAIAETEKAKTLKMEEDNLSRFDNKQVSKNKRTKNKKNRKPVENKAQIKHIKKKPTIDQKTKPTKPTNNKKRPYKKKKPTNNNANAS